MKVFDFRLDLQGPALPDKLQRMKIYQSTISFLVYRPLYCSAAYRRTPLTSLRNLPLLLVAP